MTIVSRRMDSWLSATVDVLLAVLGWSLVWYPMVSLGNMVLGAPFSDATVTLVVSVLAFGGAYPVVAGDWSLGRLGEFVFVLMASVFALGLVGMSVLFASGTAFVGSSRIPQAVLWAGAYLCAYVLVYRTDLATLR